jgi:hypothetical protein
MGSAACGIRAESVLTTVTVRGERCEPCELPCPVPEGLAPPDTGAWLEQRVVFPPGVGTADVWAALRRSHFALERLWPDGSGWRVGGHVRPLELLLPTLPPLVAGDQMVLVRSRLPGEALNFINGIATDDVGPRREDSVVAPYHTLLLVGDASALVGYLRDYSSDMGRYRLNQLAVEMWERFVEAPTSPLKHRRLVDTVFAPEQDLCAKMVRCGSEVLKKEVAQALQRGPPLVVTADLAHAKRDVAAELVDAVRVPAEWREVKDPLGVHDWLRFDDSCDSWSNSTGIDTSFFKNPRQLITAVLFEHCTDVTELSAGLSREKREALRLLFEVHGFVRAHFGVTTRLLLWNVPVYWDLESMNLRASRAWFLDSRPEPLKWGGCYTQSLVPKPEALADAIILTPDTLNKAAEQCRADIEGVALALMRSARCTNRELASQVIALHALDGSLAMNPTLELLREGRPAKRARKA